MRNKIMAALLAACLLLAGCGQGDSTKPGELPDAGDPPEALGGFDETYGEDLSDTGAYDGFFEEEVNHVTISCLSGTEGAYRIEGNTITFTAVAQDTVYTIAGQLAGNIVIDVGDEYKFDLEMHGFSLVSAGTNPVTVLSGNEVSLTAKKGYENYIYDTREAVDEADSTLYSGAIYSLVDLEIAGKCTLVVISENNNGIHSKDDLQVKNLTLTVSCMDNALKGNDSVEITGGTTTLIARRGDGIKTTNSDISTKGNQRGVISIRGGEHIIYAACDGIDAAYDVMVDGSTTVLHVYTDKYSNYSEEVTVVAEDVYYIRFPGNGYQYAVKYYNSDEDFVWVTADYHSTASSGWSSYYYYAFPKIEGYSKLQFFLYTAEMEPGQEDEYAAASDLLTPSTAYDTIALTAQGYYSWTNYNTTVQEGMGGPGGRPGGMGGPGGMQEGNTDKGDHSTKGIKAANEIKLLAGHITIKAYDDAIHANADTALENGETPTGNVTIGGGVLTVYSNDDGIHADGALRISGGTVCVASSYEGLEGTTVTISGGDVSVTSSDDGVNATTASGTAITISGGRLYVLAGGDGLDSNSYSRYTGISFSGGQTVIISTSGGNSAIDSEQGYAYTGGMVLAIMPTGGMTQELTNCQNFQSVATAKSVSVGEGECLTVSVGGIAVVTVKMPSRLSGTMVYLGSNIATVSAGVAGNAALDQSGVCWYEA